MEIDFRVKCCFFEILKFKWIVFIENKIDIIILFYILYVIK